MLRAAQELGPALVVLLLTPSAALTQRSTVKLFDVRPSAGMGMCTLATPSASAVTEAALGAMALDPADSRAVLGRLQDSVAAVARSRPRDAGAQFEVAVVLGARTEVESGRAKLSAADALLGQLTSVLALDPSHPGAQHLLGRLYAAVMRMGRVTRFAAARIDDSGLFESASWDAARRLLEAAVEGDPCSPDHRYELARLYAERGDPALALDQLRTLIRLSGRTDHERGVVDKGRVLLESLESR